MFDAPGASAMEIAGKQIGLNEREQKAALTNFLTEGGQDLDPATTAWCAAFVNATLQQSGQSGTGKLNARSFLDWGTPVDQPQPGDVAVFSRGDPNGWQGHVGFYAGDNPDGSVRVLGGNQNDAVNYSSYGRDKLLGFRRASGQGGAPAGQAPQQPASPAQSALSALFAQGGPLARQDDAAVPVDPLRTASAPQAGVDADRARRSRLAQMMVY